MHIFALNSLIEEITIALQCKGSAKKKALPRMDYKGSSRRAIALLPLNGKAWLIGLVYKYESVPVKVLKISGCTM